MGFRWPLLSTIVGLPNTLYDLVDAMRSGSKSKLLLHGAELSAGSEEVVSSHG